MTLQFIAVSILPWGSSFSTRFFPFIVLLKSGLWCLLCRPYLLKIEPFISGINFPFIYITLPRGKRLIYQHVSIRIHDAWLHDEKNTTDKNMSVINCHFYYTYCHCGKKCLSLSNDGGAGRIMILHATSLMRPMVQEEIKKRKNIIKCLSLVKVQSLESYLLDIFCRYR